MSRDELVAIVAREQPLTGRLCVALAQSLLDVLDECDKVGPTEQESGPGSSFVLGYRTKARVIAAMVGEHPLP